MVTFTISFGSTIQQITFGTISWNESTQYVMHFIIGDVIGTGIIIFVFYQFMRVAVAMRQRNNG